MRRRAAAIAGAAALAAGAMTGCGSTATSRPPATLPATPPASASASPGGQPHWLISASAITMLDDAAGRAVVARYLNGPQTTVIISGAIPPNLASWHVKFALDTRSLAQIRSDLLGMSRRISMILYDPEHWQFTPAAEQSAPGTAARTAETLVRSAGLQLIIAPATNLAEVSAPGGSAANVNAFIQTDDLGKVASSANWVDIQAQGQERNSQRYASYVKQAVSQIRSANPGAVIYAGLSTNPSGPPVTASELLADVSMTSSEVSGYWLNIPNPGASCPACGLPQPQIGLDVLEHLATGPVTY